MIYENTISGTDAVPVIAKLISNSEDSKTYYISLACKRTEQSLIFFVKCDNEKNLSIEKVKASVNLFGVPTNEVEIDHSLSADYEEFITSLPRTRLPEAVNAYSLLGYYYDGFKGNVLVEQDNSYFVPAKLEVPRKLIFSSQQFDVYPGLHIVYGPTRSGKTEFLKFITSNEDSLLLHYGEPNILSSFSKLDLFNMIINRSNFPSSITAIDSFRLLLFETGRGSITKGGIAASLFSDLTRASSIFKKMNICCFAAINPIAVDPDVAEKLYSDLESSVEGIWELNLKREIACSLRSNGRQSIRFSFDLAKGGENDKNKTASKLTKKSEWNGYVATAIAKFGNRTNVLN